MQNTFIRYSIILPKLVLASLILLIGTIATPLFAEMGGQQFYTVCVGSDTAQGGAGSHYSEDDAIWKSEGITRDNAQDLLETMCQNLACDCGALFRPVGSPVCTSVSMSEPRSTSGIIGPDKDGTHDDQNEEQQACMLQCTWINQHNRLQRDCDAECKDGRYKSYSFWALSEIDLAAEGQQLCVRD